MYFARAVVMPRVCPQVPTKVRPGDGRKGRFAFYHVFAGKPPGRPYGIPRRQGRGVGGKGSSGSQLAHALGRALQGLVALAKGEADVIFGMTPVPLAEKG